MHTLLPHYERELAWFDEATQEFARRYPRIAGRLSTSGDLLEDPHVERLIQSFALLTARLHRRLDDEFPLVTEALLELLNPLALRPVPACSIARFVADRGLTQLAGARRIPRGTLLHSAPVRGVPCRFTTAFDLALAPLRIVHAGLHRPGETALPAGAPPGTAAWFAVELELVSAAARWDTLGLAALRVFIDAQPSQAAALRSAWLDHCTGVLLDIGQGPLRLDRAELPRPVGLDSEHALVDTDERTPAAERLLTEYFAFPEKFDFVDLPLPRALHAARRRATLLYALRAPRPGEAAAWAALEGLNQRQLLPGCTPVVNLFQQRAEPIRVTQASEAYAVVVDARHPAAYEVHAVERVRRRRLCAGGEQAHELAPLYSLRHASTSGVGGSTCCWSLRRDPQRAELAPGQELELVLVDRGLDPAQAATETLSIDVRASNRDLPALLSIGQPGGDLHADGGTIADEIVLLRRPTTSRRLQRGDDTLWRLVSHLALARLPSGAAGLDGMKEMLTLHARGADAALQRIVDGLLALSASPASAWLPGPPLPSLVHGTEIRLTVAEAAFVGTGVGLFGRLLSECLALRAPVNTFTRLLLLAGDGRTLFDGGCRSARESLR